MEPTITSMSPGEIVTFNNIIIGVVSALSSIYISSKLPATSTMSMSSIIYRTMPVVIGIVIMTYLITRTTTNLTTH